MTGILHTFHSAKSDGGDTTLVRPSDWNADHDLSGMTVERAIQAISDSIPFYDASAAATRAVPPGMLRLGRAMSVVADECFFNSSSAIYEGGVKQNVSGTGAAHSDGGTVAGHPGVVDVTGGSTGTGVCTLASSAGLALGSGIVRFGVVAKQSRLSDAAQVSFTLRIGLQDQILGGDSTNGVYFRYLDTNNSGKWEGVCRAGSAESTTDTGVTADTNWHCFEAEINAAASSVTFYIDGTAASGGAVSAHIPSGGSQPVQMIPASNKRNSQTGNFPAVLSMDAYWYIYELAR